MGCCSFWAHLLAKRTVEFLEVIIVDFLKIVFVTNFADRTGISLGGFLLRFFEIYNGNRPRY